MLLDVLCERRERETAAARASHVPTKLARGPPRARRDERAAAHDGARQRARAAHVMMQRTCVEVAQEAIRVCGGRALLKQYPLERFLRDAQASSVMRPWTREIATEAAWESALRFARKKNGTAAEAE